MFKPGKVLLIGKPKPPIQKVPLLQKVLLPQDHHLRKVQLLLDLHLQKVRILQNRVQNRHCQRVQVLRVQCRQKVFHGPFRGAEPITFDERNEIDNEEH